MIFSHSLISIKETLKGLEKIEVNVPLLEEELENHYELLSEAIQTILRKNKVEDAYEKIKETSRGKTLTKEEIKALIEKLDLPKEEKNRLLSLTPKTYIGLARELAEKVE